MAESGSWHGLLPESRVGRIVGVIGIGLAASSLHWTGILLGGLLAGLLAPNLARAVIYGGAFGLLVWATFAIALATAGITPTIDGLQIYGLSMAIPVLLGGIGATARELRPWLEGVNLS